MARMAGRARTVQVWYRGIEYTLSLVKCRRGLVDSEVAGRFSSIEALAEHCAMSRSTASRFFSGRPTSLAVTLRIIAALELTFEEVATPVAGDDDRRGTLHATGGRLATT